jgi:hypothetical protein
MTEVASDGHSPAGQFAGLKATTSAAMCPASETRASDPEQPVDQFDDEERRDQPEGDGQPPTMAGAGVALRSSVRVTLRMTM